MSWLRHRREDEDGPASSLRLLGEPLVGHCGVCARWGLHTHQDDELSDDARDCSAQVATGSLICLGCYEVIRSGESLLRAILSGRVFLGGGQR